MRSLRKLLLVGVGVLSLHGLQACASETDLNPQPLPPGGSSGGGEQTPVPETGDKNGDTTGGSSGSSGTSGSPAAAADAGTDGDAGGNDAGGDN